jgi:hypothetical protein
MLIDDMEDGDRFICESGGRHGAWSVIDDGTSTSISPQGEFTPALIPGARGTSRYAAHLTGFGPTGWGAEMFVSLNDDGSAPAPHDARTSAGVKFWLKSNVPVGVWLPTSQTLGAGPPKGPCRNQQDESTCDNHFGTIVTNANAGAWTQYDLPYAAMVRFGEDYDASGNVIAGQSATWDPSQLVGVVFSVDARQTFDVWIDDLRFYDCPAGGCLPTCTDAAAPMACPAGNGVPAGCWPAGTDCARVLPLNLLDVWGSGPDDVWAIGWYADLNHSPSAGAIFHWDGVRWAAAASGAADTLAGVPLLAVWGSGPADVWAVGNRGTIVHWDGTRWSPKASGVTANLRGVAGTGPTDVWAVGNDTIIHWDGSTWAPAWRGTTERLVEVWSTGVQDVWAVGEQGVLLHWDGVAWAHATSGTSQFLVSLWASGPDDVWVVGDLGTIRHWTGTTWSPVTSGTTQMFFGIWGSAADDVWAVGTEGKILHWNGAAWSVAGDSGGIGLLGVVGSRRDDAWAVGDWGTILHWNGAAWSPVALEIQ